MAVDSLSRRAARFWTVPILLAAVGGEVRALPPSAPMAARFLKALSMGLEGAPRVATQDPALLAEFKNMGVPSEAPARVAWASSSPEVKLYLGQRKLVVVPSLELLAEGAAIALLTEEGRLSVHFSLENAKKSGHTLPDLVMKIGKPN